MLWTSGNGLCIPDPTPCTSHADCEVDLPEPLTTCCVGTGADAFCAIRTGACAHSKEELGEPCRSFGDGACWSGADLVCAHRGVGDWRCAPQCGYLPGADEQCSPPKECLGGKGGPCLERVGLSGYAFPCSRHGIQQCGPEHSCVRLGNQDSTVPPLCLPACSDDEDCAEGWWCAEDKLCMPKGGDVAVGGSCAHDFLACAEGLVCIAPATSLAVCVPARPPMCPAGTAFHYDGTWRTLGPFSGCVPWPAPHGPGEACAQMPTGCGSSGSCSQSFWHPFTHPPTCSGVSCQNPYDPDRHPPCPDGSTCMASEGGWGPCFTEVEPEVGTSCSSDEACGKAKDCTYFIDGPECRERCFTSPDAVCPEGHWCTGSACLASGTGEALAPCPGGKDGECAPGRYCVRAAHDTESLCVEFCDRLANPQCPEGRVCQPSVTSFVDLCLPPGPGGQGEPCDDDPLSCAEDHICVGRAGDQRCLQRCTGDVACPEGSHCDITPIGARWLACLPDGDRAAGEACGDDPWACEEGTHCVGPFSVNASPAQQEWSFCAKPCGGAYGAAYGGCGGDEAEEGGEGTDGGDSQECQYLARGRAYCMETGERAAGEACGDEPRACVPGTRCTPLSDGISRCLVPCLPGVNCPEGTSCEQTSAGPVLMCAPDGALPESWWEPWW